jgi:hypothetical protein
MPKKDNPRANAGTKARRTRRKRRSARRRSLRDPQTHRRTTTEIELPEWLPPAVAMHAPQISCQTASDELVLRRLASDPRMTQVWMELLKKKRLNHASTENFKYPPTSETNWSANARAIFRRAQRVERKLSPADKLWAKKLKAYAAMIGYAESLTWEKQLPIQERALVALFDRIFELARSESVPVSRPVADEKRSHMLEMAKLIRTDAAASSERFGPLIDAAIAYEGDADRKAPPEGEPLFVHRQRRGDERQTAFVLQLVEATTAIFGQPLYGIVSIVTNVAFDCRDWTDARVRKGTKRTNPLLAPGPTDP